MGVLSCNIQAQDMLSGFTYIQSQGKMPSEFKKYASNKKQPELQRIFTSGLLVYGSELNKYVEKVADNLLKDHPDLRKELKFYILRSTYVNAYAFSEKIIIINTGLLAQIENESELAFIIAHEIIHIVNKHIEKEKKIKRNKKEKSKSIDFLAYHNRSRTHEFESDREGFQRFFEKSGYNIEAIEGVFDVLQYGYLPFDQVKFKRSFVETNYYKFPDNYFLTNLTPIRSREDFVDTLSTHPNILKRRTELRALVNKSNYKNGSFFIQPEELFYKIRNIARFESINLYLTYHDYGNSLYNSYVLLNEMPENEFLKRSIVASLYGLCKHKNDAGIANVITPFKEIEGEKQQLYHFLTKISRDELYLLTLRFAFESWKQFPTNSYFETICNDLAQDLHKRNKLNYTDYSDFPMGVDIDSIVLPSDVVDSTVQVKRFDKIKNQKNKTKVIPTAKFKVFNYMLVDLRSDSTFMQLIEQNLVQMEDKSLLDQIDSKQFDSQSCPSIIVWTPKSYILKNRRWKSHNFKLEENIRYATKKHNVDALFFDNIDFETMSTELYNNYVKIQSFYYEYVNADNIEVYYYQSVDIEDVCTAFGGNCINFVTTFTENEYPFMSNFVSITSMLGLLTFTIPGLELHLYLPNQNTTANFVIINLITGKKMIDNKTVISGRNNAPALANYLYKMYYQNAPKKGKKK
jgi:Zn-dependent protease with chaperone function